MGVQRGMERQARPAGGLAGEVQPVGMKQARPGREPMGVQRAGVEQQARLGGGPMDVQRGMEPQARPGRGPMGVQRGMERQARPGGGLAGVQPVGMKQTRPGEGHILQRGMEWSGRGKAMLLSVGIVRLRQAGDEGRAAQHATMTGGRCCGSRPRSRRLEGATCVHVSIEPRKARLAMTDSERTTSTVAISSDGCAHSMGCQHSATESPPVEVDTASTNGVQISFRAEECSQQVVFVLQPRSKGRKVLGRAELEATLEREGNKVFAGWLPLRRESDKSQIAAELLVQVEWLEASRSSTAVQLVGGDAEQVISQRFSLMERLGSGSFATVWRAMPLSHDRRLGGVGRTGEVAIKLVDKAECIRVGKQQAAMQLVREQQLLRELQHPRLACCSEIVDGGTTAAYVLTLGGPHTLLSFTERYPAPLAEGTAAGILQDVAAALEYLHGCDVVHRDVKPENILLTPSGAYRSSRGGGGSNAGSTQHYRAMLADLGFATRLGPGSGLVSASATQLSHVNLQHRGGGGGSGGGGASSETTLVLSALSAADARANSSSMAAGAIGRVHRRVTDEMPHIPAESPPPRWMAHSLIGSAQYLAPEVILTMKWDSHANRFVADPTAAGYGCLADIWALGATLYKALSRRDLHMEGVKFKTLHAWAQRGAPVAYPPDEWDELSQHGVMACQSMLVPAPQARATAAAVSRAASLWAAAT